MIIKIKRYNKELNIDKFESFLYEGDTNITVASFLKSLNNQSEIKTLEGYITSRIEWDCGCLEKKCGICSMVINKRPMLACNAFLNKVAKKDVVVIEPLSKFPVIRDLRVNRKIMFDALLKLNSWSDFNENASPSSLERESSLCLMCGCCIEACPNYIKNDDGFNGAISFTNLINEVVNTNDREHLAEMKKLYNKYFKKSCTGALSCSKACPIGLPILSIMAKMNRK